MIAFQSSWWHGALLGAIAACAPADESLPIVFEEAGETRIVSLRIEPATISRRVTFDTKESIPARVIAKREGAAEFDATADATVTFEGPTLGAWQAGTLTTAGIGGHAKLLATVRGMTASATLSFELVGDVFDEGVDARARDAFAGAPDPLAKIDIDYPLEGVVLPANLPPPELQWTAPGDQLFRVSVRSSGVLDLRFYSKKAELTPARAVWSAIGASAPDVPIAMSVDGVDASGRRRWSDTRTITISADRIEQGALFAHNPGKLTIVDFMRGIEVALPSDSAEHKPGQCAGCHNVSRDGRRIGFARPPDTPNGGASLGTLRYDESRRTFDNAIRPGETRVPNTAFNPLEDSTRPAMIAAVATADRATAFLALLDPDFGTVVPSNLAETLGAVPTTIGLGSMMPAWSNDGRLVVFTAYATDVFPGIMAGARGTQGALIETDVAYEGAAFRFGSPRVLASPGPETSFHRASISTDGTAVAFTSEQRIDGVTTRQTWLVRRSDGHVFRMASGTSSPADGWMTRSPDWGPTIGARYMWLVVDSARPYGHRMTKESGLQSHLWMFAIDRAKLAAGTVDPSLPPFWVPGQRLEDSYVRAQWPVAMPALAQ